MYKDKQFDDVAKFLNLPIESVRNKVGEDNKTDMTNLKEHYKSANPLGYLNKENINYHIFKDHIALLYCSMFGIKTCMELGCGASMTSFTLARNGIKCTAYDYESDTLRFQLWRRRNYHLTNLVYRGLGQLGRNKEKYDAFVCFEVLEHIQDPRPTIDIIDKHIKPKGILILTMTSQADLPPDQRDKEHICELNNEGMVNYILEKGYMVVQGLKFPNGYMFSHMNYPLIFKKIGENNEDSNNSPNN